MYVIILIKSDVSKLKTIFFECNAFRLAIPILFAASLNQSITRSSGGADLKALFKSLQTGIKQELPLSLQKIANF